VPAAAVDVVATVRHLTPRADAVDQLQQLQAGVLVAVDRRRRPGARPLTSIRRGCYAKCNLSTDFVDNPVHDDVDTQKTALLRHRFFLYIIRYMYRTS
jgi:hypothetical protein